MNNYPVDQFSQMSFAQLAPKYVPQASSLPSGDLPTQTGWYYQNGNFTVSSSTIPSGFSSAQDFSAIFVVNGDLIISQDLQVADSSVLVFVVAGDIDIDKNVESIKSILVADGQFDSSYNGNSNRQLVVEGAVWVGEGLDLSRSLGSPNNNADPAELFIYKPDILLKSNLATLFSGAKRFIWRELTR